HTLRTGPMGRVWARTTDGPARGAAAERRIVRRRTFIVSPPRFHPDCLRVFQRGCASDQRDVQTSPALLPVILSGAKDLIAIAHGAPLERPLGPSLRSGRQKGSRSQHKQIQKLG